jgi:hypothetical protein
VHISCDTYFGTEGIVLSYSSNNTLFEFCIALPLFFRKRKEDKGKKNKKEGRRKEKETEIKVDIIKPESSLEDDHGEEGLIKHVFKLLV